MKSVIHFTYIYFHVALSLCTKKNLRWFQISRQSVKECGCNLETSFLTLIAMTITAKKTFKMSTILKVKIHKVCWFLIPNQSVKVSGYNLQIDRRIHKWKAIKRSSQKNDLTLLGQHRSIVKCSYYTLNYLTTIFFKQFSNALYYLKVWFKWHKHVLTCISISEC